MHKDQILADANHYTMFPTYRFTFILNFNGIYVKLYKLYRITT